MPAADLSEQISTAGTEASGTGNMKFALNGALTIGTWDGANIEMRQAVGREHIFIFGSPPPEVAALRAQGYDPRRITKTTRSCKRVLDAIARGAFSPDEPERYRALVDSLAHRRPLPAAGRLRRLRRGAGARRCAVRDAATWADTAILNVAGMGWFSSDRTIREYARTIWHLQPQRVVAAEHLAETCSC